MNEQHLRGLYAQLARHEGVRLKPYRDTEGKLTIGIGRNLDDVGIFPDEAHYMLEHDVAARIGALNHALPWFPRLDPVRQRILIDMAMMGVEKLLGFHRMLAALRIGDYDEAANEMLDSKWARQVGARAQRLARWMRTGQVDDQ